MQETTTWPLANRTVVTLTLIGIFSAAVAITVLAAAGEIPGVRQGASAPVVAPQASADAAYTTEFALAYENMLRAQAAGRQMTADTAYALEADQFTSQQRAQAERLYVTSDEAYVREQALMAEQSRHLAGQRGDHIPPRLRP